MYFGSSKENTTFVLEPDRATEQLRVVRSGKGVYFDRGFWNSGACVAKQEIYAFEFNDYERVFRFSLEGDAWELFYSY